MRDLEVAMQKRASTLAHLDYMINNIVCIIARHNTARSCFPRLAVDRCTHLGGRSGHVHVAVDMSRSSKEGPAESQWHAGSTLVLWLLKQALRTTTEID